VCFSYIYGQLAERDAINEITRLRKALGKVSSE